MSKAGRGMQHGPDVRDNAAEPHPPQHDRSGHRFGDHCLTPRPMAIWPLRRHAVQVVLRSFQRSHMQHPRRPTGVEQSCLYIYFTENLPLGVIGRCRRYVKVIWSEFSP